MSDDPPAERGLSDEERLWAMLANVLALVLYPLFLGQYIGPLVIYLLYKDKSRFIAFHALQSLFFQLGLLVLGVIAGIFVFFTCGIGALVVIPAAIVAPVLVVIYVIFVGIKAYNGEVYEYWIVGRWARDQVGI